MADRPQVAFQCGAMVDHYKIIRPLGMGGFGEVFLARDTQLGRKVALKVILPSRVGSRDDVERFLFEARATARLNHPHIVTVYGVGEKDGVPYVALEYLQGHTLRQRLQEKPLTVLEAVRLGLAVAEALGEAHRRKILHRDLKPENLLIPSDGRVRVVDFGLAGKIGAGGGSQPRPVVERPGDGSMPAGLTLPPPTEAELGATLAIEQPLSAAPAPTTVRRERALAEVSAERSLTLDDGGSETRTVRGTPGYMAPEQWRGEPSTPATDVWALGIILYEVLSGAQPYRDVGPLAELARAVCSSEPVPPLRASLPLPPELASLVQACVDKDPSRRPGVQALQEQLAELLTSTRRGPSADQGPFRGLLPFTEEHAGIYFGREAEVDALLEQLRLEPCLAVVGPSGVGKSSFIQAGLIPRLREQGRCLVLSLRPGRDPFRALANRLRRGESSSMSASADHPVAAASTSAATGDAGRLLLEEERLADDLLAAPASLGLRLRELAEQQQARVLLFVDQLEELCTLAGPHALQQRFMQALHGAADDAEEPVRVVLTLRDDFLGRVAALAESHDALGRVLVLRSPGRQALQRILTRPLQAAGHAFEDERLALDMIDSVGEGAASLPLLEFAARELWDRRDSGRRLLLRAAYEEIGGVVGALASHAESVLQGFSPQQVGLGRQILLRLVTADGTRRLVARSGLLEGLPAESGLVLQRLVEARLLTAHRGTGRDPSEAELELTHESLIDRWARLARWLEESREERSTLTEITQAAELWQRRGRRRAEAWEGEALEDARRSLRRLADPVPELVALFLQAGRDRQRRRGRLRLSMAVLLVLASIGGLALWMHTRSSRRMEARMAGFACLLGAMNRFESHEPAPARAWLRQSLEIEVTPETRLLWWQLQRQPERLHLDLPGRVDEIAVAADGRRAAVTIDGHGVQLLDLERLVSHRLGTGAEDLTAAAFCDDGRLVTGNRAGLLELRDPDGRPLQRLAQLPPGQATGELLCDLRGNAVVTRANPHTRRWRLSPPAAASPLETADDLVGVGVTASGLWSVARTGGWRDGGLELRRSLTGPAVRHLSTPGGLALVTAMASRGDWVAVGTNRSLADFATSMTELVGTVRLVRLTNGRTSDIAVGQTVTTMDLSADGRWLVTGAPAWPTSLWDTADGNLEQQIDTGERRIWRLKMSPDGRLLLTASTTSTRIIGSGLKVYSLAREHRNAPAAHRAGVTALAFCGGALVSAGADGRILWWRLLTGEPRLSLPTTAAPVRTIACSPDGKTLASGDERGVVRLWDSSSLLFESRAHEGPINEVTFSPDGLLVASAGKDGTVRLWDHGRHAEVRRLKLEAPVSSISFHPGGRQLAASSKALAVYEVSSGALLQTLQPPSWLPLGTTSRWGVGRIAYTAAGRLHVWTGMFQLDLTPGVDAAEPKLIHSMVSPSLRPGTDELIVVEEGLGCQLCRASRVDPGRNLLGRLINHRSPITDIVADRGGRWLATAGGSEVRLWDADGRPSWRAPLLLPSPPRLLDHQGWLDLRRGERRPLGGSRWERAAQQSWLAASDEGSGLLCLLDHAGDLELWDRRADRRFWRRHEPLARDLLVAGGSCFTLSERRVARHPPDAPPRALAMDRPLAIASQRGELWVSSAAVTNRQGAVQKPQQIAALSADGARVLRRRRMADDVTAMAALGEGLVVGLRSGLVHAHSSWSEDTLPRTLAPLDNSTLLRLLAGPQRTLIGGYNTGDVVLWDLRTGKRLARWFLNGPVFHLHLDDGHLYAATETGDSRVIDLTALVKAECQLLREVWASVPHRVVDEKLVYAPPDRGHRCALRP